MYWYDCQVCLKNDCKLHSTKNVTVSLTFLMLYTFKVTINNNGTSTVIQQEACLCHRTLPQYPSAPETQYVRGSAQRCILQPSHALSSLHPLYLSQFSPVIFGHLLSLLVTTRSNFLPENDYEIINAHFFSL